MIFEQTARKILQFTQNVIYYKVICFKKQFRRHACNKMYAMDHFRSVVVLGPITVLANFLDFTNLTNSWKNTTRINPFPSKLIIIVISCSFQSFYLPGSVDIRDQPIEDWNNKPPPLSLWSRPDWTTKHKAIAKERGHMKKT